MEEQVSSIVKACFFVCLFVVHLWVLSRVRSLLTRDIKLLMLSQSVWFYPDWTFAIVSLLDCHKRGSRDRRQFRTQLLGSWWDRENMITESSTGCLCVTAFSISCFLSLIVPCTKTCHSISLSLFRLTLHLVFFDRRANYFLLFLSQGLWNKATWPTSLQMYRPFPMECSAHEHQGVRLFILSGLLSRRIIFHCSW